MRKSKFLILVTTAVLSFSFSVESVAAVDFESVSSAPITSQETAYSGICGAEGDNIQWNYDAASETITFSGTGAMKTYYKKAENDGEQDFYENPEWVLLPVCNIVFEDGITDIGCMLKDFFHTPSDRGKQTVFLPESVTKWGPFMYEFAAIKAPYGSAAYYAFADRPNYSFFGYGIAKNPVHETTGTSEYGATWSFDYFTQTVTISGPGFALPDEFDVYPYKSIIIEDSVTVPEDGTYPGKDYSKYVLLWAAKYMGHVDELPIIYASSTSEFAKEFAKLPDNIRVSAPNIVYSDETAYVGDVNLDGEVNLKDAVLLNKCVNGSVTYNEIQKANMDCNGDGVISADDTLTLLKFLIQLINQL